MELKARDQPGRLDLRDLGIDELLQNVIRFYGFLKYPAAQNGAERPKQ
jgi:hypothetical protein